MGSLYNSNYIRKKGTAHYVDLIDGISMREVVDDVTGISSRQVVDWKQQQGGSRFKTKNYY